jgi:hypothetical protein
LILQQPNNNLWLLLQKSVAMTHVLVEAVKSSRLVMVAMHRFDSLNILSCN